MGCDPTQPDQVEDQLVSLVQDLILKVAEPLKLMWNIHKVYMIYQEWMDWKMEKFENYTALWE